MLFWGQCTWDLLIIVIFSCIKSSQYQWTMTYRYHYLPRRWPQPCAGDCSLHPAAAPAPPAGPVTNQPVNVTNQPVSVTNQPVNQSNNSQPVSVTSQCNQSINQTIVNVTNQPVNQSNKKQIGHFQGLYNTILSIVNQSTNHTIVNQSN